MDTATKKQRQKSSRAPLSGLEFLTQYFQFGYLLQLLPYKIVETESKTSFAIHTSVRQKICCAVTNLIALFAFTSYTRALLIDNVPVPVSNSSNLGVGNEVASSTVYVGIVKVTSWLNVLHKAVFLLSFWLNYAGCLGIFQEIRARIRPSSSSDCIKKKYRTFSIFLCILCMFMAVTSTFAGSRLGLQEWTAINFVLGSAQHTRAMFFMNLAPPSPASPTSTDYALCVIQIVIRLCSQLTAFWMELCVQTFLFTYAWVCVEYVKSFKGSSSSSAKQVLEGYADLKVITDRINSVGILIFAGCLLGMVYDAVHMTELLQSTQWFPKLRYLFFMISFLVSLLVASWATNFVERELLEWIADSRNAEQLTGIQLAILINELNKHRVGISAGLVTITYSFIGTVNLLK